MKLAALLGLAGRSRRGRCSWWWLAGWRPGELGRLGRASLGAAPGGRVVTKAALWLPYAVTVIAVPWLAVAAHRRATLRLSIMALVGLGVFDVAGILVLGDVLFPLAVGAEYGAVSGWLWLFAAEGALFAIAQLVVMSRIAATDRRVAPLLWAAARRGRRRGVRPWLDRRDPGRRHGHRGCRRRGRAGGSGACQEGRGAGIGDRFSPAMSDDLAGRGLGSWLAAMRAFTSAPAGRRTWVRWPP